MKRIIVPVDFSEQSVQALEHAISLSNHFNSDIRLIHVIKTYLFYHPILNCKPTSPSFDFINEKMQILIDKYGRLTESKMDFMVHEGKVYSEICTQASTDDTWLIIMGAHGISGFDERWAGSNTLRVVSVAPCPVLTIRKDCPPVKYKRILLPIDSSGESRQKVPFVADLALSLGAEVNLLMVVEKNNSNESLQVEELAAQVGEYFTKKGILFKQEKKSGMNMGFNTLEYSRSIKADLIAIMTERNENQMNSWIGAYASQIINHSPIPVLNFNPL